ncbi:MAG: isoprenyl transferase [Gammaproteobacteria bacterium]|nr:isoprenyl transferase [Gammaproteobacteria bacterium]
MHSSSTANRTLTSAAGVLPYHIAIIMDGNGRWAVQRHLPRSAGHKAGTDAVDAVVRASVKRGIGVLTLFAFSSENWSRPQTEVSLLLDLFLRALQSRIQELHRNNIRLRVIGERAAFSVKLQAQITAAEELTQANTGLVLNIAANYGGRWDIVQAARQIAQRVERGDLPATAIDDAVFASHLSLAGLPEPDLFIRTGGEQRISNFLLWQLAYTELYFTDVLWPDFDAAAFDLALSAYAQRQRRFGRVSEGDTVANEQQATGA